MAGYNRTLERYETNVPHMKTALPGCRNFRKSLEGIKTSCYIPKDASNLPRDLWNNPKSTVGPELFF